jgi:hypothetical protein
MMGSVRPTRASQLPETRQTNPPRLFTRRSTFALVAILISTALAAADESTAISKLIDDINAAVRTDKARMLSIITINIDVATTTLEQEKARTGLSFGDIYVAHSLALATKKPFSSMVALKKSGQSWAQIAKSHNVTLKGSRELIKEMHKQ